MKKKPFRNALPVNLFSPDLGRAIWAIVYKRTMKKKHKPSRISSWRQITAFNYSIDHAFP
jgi:hypothetical protein